MRSVLVLTMCLWATGCASSRPFVDEPIIDRKGVDMSRYYVDKAECDVFAKEVRTGEKVARGTVGGAVVGGAIGAIVSRGPDSAERGASVGAVTGGVLSFGQCGGLALPLLYSLVLSVTQSYKLGFFFCALPALVIGLLLLYSARHQMTITHRQPE